MKLKFRQILYIVFAIAAFALLITVVVNSQSPESLMTPPEASGDYKDIQDVIEKSVDDGVILKAPNQGEYTTAINFLDFNADGNNDALAFYRMKSDDTSSIYMSVLINNGSKWIACEPVKGKGNDILEFSYGDLNYDAVPEIVIGWNMFDSKDNNTLCIYSVAFEEHQAVVKLDDAAMYTVMRVDDILDEGKNEILLIKNTFSDEGAPASAGVYELEDSKLKLADSVALVRETNDYKNLGVQSAASGKVFFLDGAVGDDSMLTEILCWNKAQRALVNVTGNDLQAIETRREGRTPSGDINGDSKIEIPFNGSVDASGEYICLTEWKQFEEGGYIAVAQGVCTDKLIFQFPEQWRDNIAVKQSGNVCSFFDVSGEEPIKLFDLVISDIADWQPYAADYDKLMIDYGTIYGVRLASGSAALALTKNEIKNCIINIR